MNTMIDPETYDVGVIVGRFQVHALHDGHRHLIDRVVKAHRKVVIILGMAPTINTTNNPLDFESRRQMLQEAYPQVNILHVRDVKSDEAWSRDLDRQVGMITSPTQSVVLYGSRDSFIDSYKGRYATFELLQEHYLSGSEVRNQVRQESRNSEDFRAGVIWASANRFPTVYPCVDVAIFNPDFTKIALGRKPDMDVWCLIGGFADPDSNGFEFDAYREVAEETGMGLNSLEYLSSFAVADWRYSKEPDTIKTLLFKGTTDDRGRAADDIEELAWFTVEHVRNNPKMIMESHRPLIERALEGI